MNPFYDQFLKCDFFSSFFFLLQNYDAKISDFGLAKNGPVGENSHVTTRVMGTYGYAAPEYVATGKISYLVATFMATSSCDFCFHF